MTQPPAPDWAARLALNVAREVRRHRQAQGLSAQQLADRCAQIGMPIQRSVLANLESGRRTTVNVAELLVLAFALQVPPGALMFPVGHEPHAEVLPDAWVEPGTAVEWLAGYAFFTAEAGEAFPDSPLGVFRLHQDAANALRRAIQAKDYAVRELTRATAEHEKDARLFHELTQEAAELRRKLNVIAAAAENQQPYDFDEGERLSARHSALMDQVAAVQAAEGAIRYAQQRANSSEASVRSKESALRGIREKMKSEGLVLPMLPRSLIYLDPDTTAFEDVPVKREIQYTEGGDVAVDTGLSVPEEPVPEEQLDLFVASSDEDRLRVRELLEELQPKLKQTINEAVEQAFRRREQEGK